MHACKWAEVHHKIGFDRVDDGVAWLEVSKPLCLAVQLPGKFNSVRCASAVGTDLVGDTFATQLAICVLAECLMASEADSTA